MRSQVSTHRSAVDGWPLSRMSPISHAPSHSKRSTSTSTTMKTPVTISASERRYFVFFSSSSLYSSWLFYRSFSSICGAHLIDPRSISDIEPVIRGHWIMIAHRSIGILIRHWYHWMIELVSVTSKNMRLLSNRNRTWLRINRWLYRLETDRLEWYACLSWRRMKPLFQST